jgi:tRNA (guanine37-N1)-methyltransferase
MRKVCIQVPQHLGEQIRTHLVKQGLLDDAFPISQQDDQLCFPLKHPLSKEARKTLEVLTSDYTLVTKELTPLTRKPHNLAAALTGKLPDQLLDVIPHSFDIIGEIAVVELDSRLEPNEKLIGQAIMTVNSRIKTVFVKEGGVDGVYRVRPLRRIAGKAQTTTIHTEYGVRIAVDVTKTYFSPRLSTEHDRIANLVQPDEVIVDMFTGVGPFALLTAKRQRVKVYAIDINEQAIQCLKKSLELNRLRGEVIALAGDARAIIEQSLKEPADRVIMNLPHSAIEYIEPALQALKSTGGIIHFYGITNESQSLETLADAVMTQITKCKRTAEILHTRTVRPSAPHEFQVVLDLRVS